MSPLWIAVVAKLTADLIGAAARGVRRKLATPEIGKDLIAARAAARPRCSTTSRSSTLAAPRPRPNASACGWRRPANGRVGTGAYPPRRRSPGRACPAASRRSTLPDGSRASSGR